MAETDPGPAPKDPAPAPRTPPDDRLEGLAGRTTISERVLERLAGRIVLDVPGVVRHSSGNELFPGASLPSASAETAGDRVRLRLEVAVDWGTSAREVAAAARTEVRSRLSEATGKMVDRVDVTVAALVPARNGTDRRRVQ